MGIINVDSFGSDCPVNWEEIAAYLNAIIMEKGIADDYDETQTLWEQYCNGDLPEAPKPIMG